MLKTAWSVVSCCLDHQDLSRQEKELHESPEFVNLRQGWRESVDAYIQETSLLGCRVIPSKNTLSATELAAKDRALSQKNKR